jgi:AraC-like DNA-binding protein
MRKGKQKAMRASERLPGAGGVVSRLAYTELKTNGIVPGPLLKKAGLTREQIENPQATILVRDQIAFLNVAAESLGDKLLGFRLAQRPDLREFGLLYYVLASSETLIEALQRAARYSSIANRAISQQCIDGRTVGLSFRYVGVSRHIDCHQIEFWMAATVRVCRQLTGMRLVPSRVRLVHRRAPTPEFAECLGNNIEFGAANDEIVFASSFRETRIVSADPYLSKLLTAYCDEAIAHRPASHGPFRSRVENIVATLLPHGKARTSEVARQLGVSQRTLTRRLAEEGLSFSEVLEELRGDLARRYLTDRDLPISQIAWLLGYREVGAFSHAFKRWTGAAPRKVRAEHAV